MSRFENPPFERGQTWYGGGTIDSNNLTGADLEGAEWEFDDLDLTNPASPCPKRTNGKVLCRAVRNVGASALLPKYAVTFQKTAGYYGKRVDGMVTLDNDRCYVVDEWLPAAGCPVNDICWIVIKGPAMFRTSLGADATNVVNVGDVVVGLTAATSGATTAGRVQPQVMTTAATAPLGNMVQNRVGNALSARTTANTNVDLLVEVGHF